MSEKRFQKGVNLSCVDTETGKSYWYACNLCGLLNELYGENKKLKHINNQLEERLESSGIGVALKMDCEKRKIQRFNLDEGRIWEAIEGLSPFKTTYTLEEVCEKLNELTEENEQLKKRNKFLEEFDGQAETVANLKAENEQLKQTLENIGLHEKNDAVKMIEGKFFIRM